MTQEFEFVNLTPYDAAYVALAALICAAAVLSPRRYRAAETGA